MARCYSWAAAAVLAAASCGGPAEGSQPVVVQATASASGARYSWVSHQHVPPTPQRSRPLRERFVTGEPAAVAQARAKDRPLLVYFHADWCVACRKLMQQTFADPAVGQAAQDYVPLLVDMTLDHSAGTDAIEAREMQLHAVIDLARSLGREHLLSFLSDPL